LTALPTSPIGETDVLIVGAGPVGLFLANECARRKMRHRLVEERAGQSEHSKALAIFPRTLEIFDMAGIAAPFLEAANRVTSVTIRTRERTLARMPFVPRQTPYPFVAMVPQDVTEKVLAAELGHRGGAVEYETRFVSAAKEDGTIRAVLDHKGERFEIRASFLVGCDGAHSAVRHLLNIPFEGAAYKDSFVLADVETNDAFPASELQLCPSESGPVAIFPMSPTRRRIVASIDRAEGDAPSLAVVRRILAERAPAGIEARSLRWSSYFRIHHRHVARLRVGRFFIAGDAAHIHSPFGGQGMNTGLHDVWNLAWKLDLFLAGHGNEELLDSYGAERLPVIAQVIEITHLLTRALGTPSRFAQGLRDAVIPMVSRLVPFQHAFVQRLSELGVSYGDSPIVDGSGERFLDDSMRGGRDLGRRFLLFLDDESDAGIQDGAMRLAESLGDVLEVRFAPKAGITLVRPDGYVAYAAHGRRGLPDFLAVRSLLDRQTSVSAPFGR
jgi:2-polyprenyl-6-methoxyphenol hydroxylase-like FAD-dependent oxidoreductase